MNPTSVIALFCDDIRVEQSGALILIGVLSDNIAVPRDDPPPPTEKGETFVRVLPRLAIYVRVNFDVSAELGAVKVKITLPDGAVIHDEEIDEKTIEQARATKKKGNPMAGLMQRLQFGNLPIAKLGRMTVHVNVGKQTYLAGFLNFVPED